MPHAPARGAGPRGPHRSAAGRGRRRDGPRGTGPAATRSPDDARRPGRRRRSRDRDRGPAARRGRRAADRHGLRRGRGRSAGPARSSDCSRPRDARATRRSCCSSPTPSRRPRSASSPRRRASSPTIGWPGGLTLVLRQRPDAGLPPELTGGAPTIGLRLPDHPAPRALAAALGPLPTTSANLAGRPVAATALEIVEQLGDAVAVVLDGGPARGPVASTVVDCSGALPRILRAGALPPARLAAALDDGGASRTPSIRRTRRRSRGARARRCATMSAGTAAPVMHGLRARAGTRVREVA